MEFKGETEGFGEFYSQRKIYLGMSEFFIRRSYNNSREWKSKKHFWEMVLLFVSFRRISLFF